MYSIEDFKTKKALKEAVAAGRKLGIYQPGPYATGNEGNLTGTVALEGPHYPKPHTWYATATLKDGVITSVK